MKRALLVPVIVGVALLIVTYGEANRPRYSLRREPMVKATFHPQAWVNDYAIDVDPEGETSWDCTYDFLVELPDGWEDDDAFDLDRLRDDPAAPAWVSEWRGPFYVTLDRWWKPLSDEGAVIGAAVGTAAPTPQPEPPEPAEPAEPAPVDTSSYAVEEDGVVTNEPEAPVEPAPAPTFRPLNYDDDGVLLCGEPGNTDMNCRSSQIACDVMNGRITQSEYWRRWQIGDLGGVGDCNAPRMEEPSDE